MLRLSIITEVRLAMAMKTKLAPVSPGEMRLEEFLKPMAMSQYRLAKEIDVPLHTPPSTKIVLSMDFLLKTTLTRS